jgi:membrane protein implicated in regulation of membrane protease activity
VRTFSGEIGAALSAFAVLLGLAATVFVIVFLFSLWWVDLAAAAALALVAVGLWRVSIRRTVLTPATPAPRDRRVSRRRASGVPRNAHMGRNRRRP